jgi:NADP-dependent 3-hydroxy acid dehydrogenase YdfG
VAEAPRTVIVTGASSGIGAATALAFGELGWHVAIGARRAERLEEVAKEVEAAGGKAFAHRLDVVDSSSVDAFCAAAREALGAVDVLVNNAGQNLPALVAEATDEELKSDLEVNLLGAMYVTRRLLPDMIARRAGDVVFIGSDSAANPRPYQSAYGAAKAGLEVFARAVAMETEGTGVRSILLRVGPAASEFGNRMPQDRVNKMLESWKYWGVMRHLHWMPTESVARAVIRAVSVPVEESYPSVIEIQPGGRKKDFDR